MKSEGVQHLDEEQIIQAVVDANDLPRSVQAHLAGCGQCQADKHSFEHEIALLGQKVERFAPKPQRRIILPVQKSGNPFSNWLDWRNLAAAATTVAAIFILVWGTNMARRHSETGSAGLKAEMLEAEILMTEVNTLVDNALPPFYLEISGENKSDDDEDFYQFLIPTTEDKAFKSRIQTKNQGMRRVLVGFQIAPLTTIYRYAPSGPMHKADQVTNRPGRTISISDALASDRVKKGTSLC